MCHFSEQAGLTQYYFSLLPPPSAASTSSSSTYALFLGRSRAEYAELRDRFLRSPDGGWVADGETEGGTSKDGPGRKASPSTLDVNVNNPLSQEPSNLWGTWFDDLELRRTIRQDVKRTCVLLFFLYWAHWMREK